VGLNIFQRRRILKGANYLELKPVRKQAFETDDDGKVTLLVPKFSNKALSDFLIPKSKTDHFKIRLDELGSATWLAIDGKLNVGQLCDKLANALGEKIHPVHERVPKFLTLMYEQRYITFQELLDAEKRY
jgi:hypothetical protein